MCRIRALAMGHSPSSKHWLNILVNSTTSSFIGSISVAADLTLLKDFFFMNATGTTSVHSIPHNHTILRGNRHRNSSQTEETLKPSGKVETSRKRRAVNEAQDLAVLMQGENPESKSKIVDLISSNFAIGRFNDPVVSKKSPSWNARLGRKMGSMVQNLYSDLNAQSSASQVEAQSELDAISPAMIQLRRKIKAAERNIARYELSLKEANKEHEDAVTKGGDASQTEYKKSHAERKLNFWTQSLENMKKEYETKYIGSSSRAGRRLQAAVYLAPEWSEWTPWSKCSVDCGDGGFSVRRRECLTLPAPACPGAGFDMRPCHTGIKCQAHFHEWGEWGPCSVTCGKGVRARSRVCVTGDREMKCKGPSTTLEKCTLPKCTKPVTAAPVKPVAPVLAAPSVAYILSPGIALGNNIYPVAQPAYGVQPASGQKPAEMVAVPEIGPQYHPHSFRAGGAAGFGAVAAGSVMAAAGAGAVAAGGVGAAKGPLSKVTVVETGDEGGPFVLTHHETETEEEQSVTPETILFIVLFLLCLLLLIIAFCIYFYQRSSDSKARKRLKDAKPFYKQDPGDDEDLDKQPAQGRVKPISRPGFGFLSEISTAKEPAVQPPPCVCPEERMYPPIIPEPLQRSAEIPWYENIGPPADQTMLAGEQARLDVVAQPEVAQPEVKLPTDQGMALGEMNQSDEELGKKKRKSKQGKELGGKRKSAEGKELSGKRRPSGGKEPGGKRKSAKGKELSGEETSATEGEADQSLVAGQGKKPGGKRKSAKGKELGGKKNSATEGESAQSLVAGQKASEGKGADKKEKSKKGKKSKSSSGSSLTSGASKEGNPTEGNVSASNISFDATDQEEVNFRLQQRQRRTSSRDHSAGDFLWQDGVFKHVSPLTRATNMKEQFLPDLRSTPHLKNPVVEGKHIWALPADQAQYFENLSSKHKTMLNYSLLLPSSEPATPVVLDRQGKYRNPDCDRFFGDTEGKIKPYHETKRWNGKMRKFRYRKRTNKRAERKMNTYLKSVFRQKCRNMLCEKYKHRQFGVGTEKNIGGVNVRSLQKSRGGQSSESDTYPKDDSPISANSSFYSSKFSAAKAVNKAEEVQQFVNQEWIKKSDLGPESKPDSEFILSCETKGSVGNKKQTLSFDLRSRSLLHNRFPFSVYSVRRQRRGKFTSSSSSSWLSTLLSESDRKLNEIERDMDAVLKEQCRVRNRSTISSSIQGIRGDTLHPPVIDVKDGDIFTSNQLGRTPAKISSEAQKFTPEDISLQGDTASKSEIKCLEESESADSTQPMLSEEPVKCDEGDSVHAYEKKKEDILKLLHSTPLYQNRGQTMYYGDSWKILQPQVTSGDHAHQGCRLLVHPNPKGEIENIKGREDIFLTSGEHTSCINGASLTSQATSAVWADQDSQGDFKTTSDTSSVPPSSTNQTNLTDSSETNTHTTCVSLPFTSSSLLNDMWQTERNKVLKVPEVSCSVADDNCNPNDMWQTGRNKVLKVPEVSCSVADDNCNPNDDTWRDMQKTASEKSELVGIRNQVHALVHKKPDVHGSVNVHLQLQEYLERAAGFPGCGDGKQQLQTVQGQNTRQPADCQIFLLNPQMKDQNSLDRRVGAPTSRSFGSKEPIDDKINTGVKLTCAAGRSSVQDSGAACRYTDTPSHFSGSTSMPTSVMSSYQDHVYLQNNDKRTGDQSGPVRQSHTGFEQILDKQLEQFVDSTSWISAKDLSKIHIEWNVNRDSKRKMFEEMCHRSMLPQDTHHFEASSISSAVTSTRGLDSDPFSQKSNNLTKFSGSMFHKRATQETYQGKLQEHQQWDRCNTASAIQNQAWRMHEGKHGPVFAQSSYQSCPEVSRTSDRTVPVSGGDRTVSVSGDSTTLTENSKWYSACSDVPKSTHYYRMSSDVPNTPDMNHGQANTCDSLASICDNFATPESEMSWETSRTNDSPCKSTYESPCKDECEFYTRNTSCNSSIPSSLNRTFSLESASSCNNSAVCNTGANLPNLSEFHSFKTDQPIPSSSRNISTEDEDNSIFKEVISSYDNCSDNIIISDKELLSFPVSLTSRMSSTESSDFDSSRLDLCNNQDCSSYTDSQSEGDVSKKQQNKSKLTHVNGSCNDSVCKENSNYDTFSVSVQFSEESEIMKTSSSKEQEETYVCQPDQIHTDRLGMGQEFNQYFTQEADSVGFNASPRLPPHQLQKLSLHRTSKELPLLGTSQTLSWSAESLVVNSFSGKSDDPSALVDIQQPGDLSTPVDNSDDIDPWETRIDYMSFVNEADIVGSQRSLKQNTTFSIVSPPGKYSWLAETPSSHPCSIESSVREDKLHMSKCPETGHIAGQVSHDTCDFTSLDQKYRSEEIQNISGDLMADFCPRTDINSCQEFSSSDRCADLFRNTAAARCILSFEDNNSENDPSSNKHSEMKHTEHFVQKDQKSERQTSVQTQKKYNDEWNTLTDEENMKAACGTEFDFQEFLLESVGHDSFSGKLELATGFFSRVIQWSPLFDGQADIPASGSTTSVSPSWTMNPSGLTEQAQGASSSSLRSNKSKDMQPSWTLDPLAVIRQEQEASSTSLRLDECQEMQCKNLHHTSITTASVWPSWTLNSPADIGHVHTASGISLGFDESHDMQPKNLHHRTKTLVERKHQTAVDSASICGFYQGFGNTTTSKLEESDHLEKSRLLEKSDFLEMADLLEMSHPLEKSKYLGKSDPLEKSSPHTTPVLKRGEYLSCEENYPAALDRPERGAYCCENVLSKSTAQATSLLSGSVFRSSPTPKENLLKESDLRPGQMLIAETAAQQSVENRCVEIFSQQSVENRCVDLFSQQSVENRCVEIFSSKLNSRGTDSSVLSCGSNIKQENSKSLAQESCFGFTTTHALYTDMKKSNITTTDSFKDELHDLSNCDEETKTQGSVFNLVPDLAVTVLDKHESDAISENLVCNGESSVLSSMYAVVNCSSSDGREHETSSSSLFSGRNLTSDVDSHGNLLCGGDPQNLTCPDTLSGSREVCSSCPHRSGSCSTGYQGDNEYWKPTAKQDLVNITEWEHCDTVTGKSVLFSSPESVHSSILDSSYRLDLSSDENNVNYTNKHMSVSHCDSCESNFHSKELDSFLPGCSCSDEKHSHSPASYSSAVSAHKKKVFFHRENTFGLFNATDATDWYNLGKQDSHSDSLSSKSSLRVAENYCSNLYCSYNEGRRSSSSSVKENSHLDKFNILDQSVVHPNLPISEIPPDLAWTKSVRIIDESVCSTCVYPSDESIMDDWLSSSCMPQSSTTVDEPSVGDTVRSYGSCTDHPHDTCCRQELCRRQSCNQLQYENDCLREYSDVINHSFDTAEPRLAPASSEHRPQSETFPQQEISRGQSCKQLHFENGCSLEFSEVMDFKFDTDEPELISASSNHYPQIVASCLSELPRRHTSNPELDRLCADEYSEVAIQSFNTEEPELVLYSSGSQHEVECASSSLRGNNKLVRTVDVRDRLHTRQTGSTLGQHVEGPFVPGSPYESACSLTLEADQESLTTDVISSLKTCSAAGCVSVETHGQTTACVSDLLQKGSTSHLCLVSKYVDVESESPDNVHPSREKARECLRKIRKGYESKLNVRKDYASTLNLKSECITIADVYGESSHIPNLSYKNVSDYDDHMTAAHVNDETYHSADVSGEDVWSSSESQDSDSIRTSYMNVAGGHTPTLSGADVSGSSRSLMTMWSPLDCMIPADFSSQFESSSLNLSLCSSLHHEQSSWIPRSSDSSTSSSSRGDHAYAGTSTSLSSFYSNLLRLSPESSIRCPADSLPLTDISEVGQKITPRTGDCDYSRSETEV